MPRKQPRWYRVRKPTQPQKDDIRYATRGIVDTTRMAATGIVGIGLLGTLGGLIKK